MKRILLLQVLFLLGCSSPVDEAFLVDVNGITYRGNSENPYSGEVISFYENENKKLRGFYKNGRKDALWTTWYDNGQKSREQGFKDGKIDGSPTVWYKDGGKMKFIYFKDLKDLENLEGKSVYTDINHIYYEFSGLAFELNENGWREKEIYFQLGIMHGSATIWYENGMKRGELTYKRGKLDGLATLWDVNGKIEDQAIYDYGRKLNGTPVLTNPRSRTSQTDFSVTSQFYHSGTWRSFIDVEVLHKTTFDSNELRSYLQGRWQLIKVVTKGRGTTDNNFERDMKAKNTFFSFTGNTGIQEYEGEILTHPIIYSDNMDIKIGSGKYELYMVNIIDSSLMVLVLDVNSNSLLIYEKVK